MDTKAVLDHHLAAFGAGDVDEVLRDYREDSVIITPRGVIRGMEEARAFFTQLFAEMFAPGTYEFTLDLEQVAGEIAHIAWHATTASADLPFGSDTFVVRDGAIVAQTVALMVQPR